MKIKIICFELFYGIKNDRSTKSFPKKAYLYENRYKNRWMESFDSLNNLSAPFNSQFTQISEKF